MVLEFGDFALDEGSYQLRRSGTPLALEPKVFDVLCYLMRHRGRVVSKDELLEKLWPGEFVTESVLPSNVAQLRRALGDDRRGRFIKTVYGRGYQFVAEVREARAAAPLQEEPRSLFVGRAAEVEALLGAFDAVAAGSGRMVLVVGEPGIGKTRTIDELASTARNRGARVLVGRCYEGEGAPAFWPWVQILRAALGDRAPDETRADLAQAAPDVAQLVPELRDALPEIAEPGNAEPEEARFRLFDGVTRYLLARASTEPVVVVLDDLHWADKPSLLLLRFLARAIRDARILVVGAYRDVEVRRGQPLAQLLGELTSEPHCLRVPLRGLDRDEVARFVGRVHLPTETPALAERIHERTGGNPYFVEEIVRLLSVGGDSVDRALPEGVRDAIGRRLDGLSEECNRVLSLASVIGRDFALPALQRVAELPAEQLFEQLDEAVRARILRESPTSVGSYQFEHALVRETLYGELSAPRRAHLHARVGEALESLHQADLDAVLAELAHHFLQAAPAGNAEKAVDFARLAAQRAQRLTAYEEGVGHCERALEALELANADELRRCELLVELGYAWALAGEREPSRRTFSAAAAIARERGAAELLAEAALGFGGLGEFGWGPDEQLRTLLEDARKLLEGRDSALLSRVLSRLSGTHPYLNTREVRIELAREAMEMARRLDDRDALLEAIEARAFESNLGLPADDCLEERDERAAQALALAARPPSPGQLVVSWDPDWMVHDIRMGTHLARGDMAAARREHQAAARVTETRRLLYQYNWLEADRFGFALGAGRYEDAIRHVEESRRLARRMNPSLLTIGLARSILLSRDLGPEHLHPAIRDEMRGNQILQGIRADFPWLDALAHCLGGIVHLLEGRAEAARQILDEQADRGFVDPQADMSALSVACFLAEMATALDETECGAPLYETLAPFAHWNVLTTGGSAYLGSASHFLGLCAALQGRHEEAVTHLRVACDYNLGIESPAHAARSRLELALALARLDGRSREARTQLEEAERTIRLLGLKPLAPRVDAVRAALA